MVGRHINQCVLIAGLGVQMGTNFTYCHAQHLVHWLPQWHTDANDRNHQSLSFGSTVANRDLQANHQGIGC